MFNVTEQDYFSGSVRSIGNGDFLNSDNLSAGITDLASRTRHLLSHSLGNGGTTLLSASLTISGSPSQSITLKAQTVEFDASFVTHVTGSGFIVGASNPVTTPTVIYGASTLYGTASFNGPVACAASASLNGSLVTSGSVEFGVRPPLFSWGYRRRRRNGADSNSSYSITDGDMIYVDDSNISTNRSYTALNHPNGANNAYDGTEMMFVNNSTHTLTIKDQSTATITTLTSSSACLISWNVPGFRWDCVGKWPTA